MHNIRCESYLNVTPTEAFVCVKSRGLFMFTQKYSSEWLIRKFSTRWSAFDKLKFLYLKSANWYLPKITTKLRYVSTWAHLLSYQCCDLIKRLLFSCESFQSNHIENNSGHHRTNNFALCNVLA